MRALGLVWDAERGRLRAGVRIALHLLALGVMLATVDRATGVLPPIVVGPVAFAGVILITFLAARFLDRRAFRELGLRVDATRALDFAAGALVGTACIALVACLESALGAASYAARDVDGARGVRIAYVAVFFAGVAVQEELVFRGYHLLNLTEGLASARLSPQRAAALATLIASAGFGLAHAGNEGASLLATLQVAVAGGTLLAVGFVLTGDLAYSIGLHLAWNFAQCVLGMPVSGFVLGQAAVFTRATHGSDLLTGGAFGPEASLLGLLAMLVGTGASLAWVRARYGPLTLRLRLETTVTLPPPSSSSEPPSGGH